MFKIDRKKTICFISSIALLNAISLPGCSSKNDEDNYEQPDKHIMNEEADSTCIYFSDNNIVLIPIDYATISDGIVRIDLTANKEIRNLSFCSKDSIIVYGNSDINSYDIAYNIALGLLENEGNIYNYADIIEGDSSPLDNYESKPLEDRHLNLISAEEVFSTCIYHRNDKVILIPIDYADYRDNVLRIDCTPDISYKNIIVSNDDSMIVYGDDFGNSYDKALEISQTLYPKCEIYNYRDIIRGQYISLNINLNKTKTLWFGRW